VVSTGRTSFVDEPCEQRGEGTAGEAAATVSVVVALSSALATPPRVALTVRGDLDVNDAMRLLPVFLPSRQDLDSIWMPSGRLVQVGGATMNPLNLVPNDVRGTPMATLVATDPALGSLSADQMFASMFKMNKASFKNQPATVVLNDCAAACTDKLLSAWQPSPGLVNPGRINPGQIIWVEGDMTIESDLILGSAEAPVLIMATGNINLDAASVSIVGVLYSQAASWNNAGLGDIKVQGAAVAEGDFVAAGVGSGGTEWLQYDPLVLRWLRLSTGSFVRVPGSWRDFP
jgi:hypothetical protein